MRCSPRRWLLWRPTRPAILAATTTPTPTAAPSPASTGFVMTPWTVEAKGPRGIDYTRVRETFKAQPITPDITATLSNTVWHSTAANNTEGEKAKEKEEKKGLHHLFRRGIVFAHRDLDTALRRVATTGGGSGGAYLYTGRGPSSATMHVGHAVPFLLCRHLQQRLGLPLVVQITDDEKFLFRDVDYAGAEAERRVKENIKDIIAFGFEPQRTFIFRNTRYMGTLYPTVLALQRSMTCSAVRHTLGLSDTDNVGKFAFAPVQAAPCFSTSFPVVLPARHHTPLQCIVPCAVDQDPFFVLARHAASRVPPHLAGAATAPPKGGCPAPATVYTALLPSLRGPSRKMSSSGAAKDILALSDSAANAAKKIRKAFSGGAASLAEMQRGQVDLEVDVAYQLLRFFCPDDDVLAEVGERYAAGRMNSSDVKAVAAQRLELDLLAPWRARREAITDADVEQFCAVRSLL